MKPCPFCGSEEVRLDGAGKCSFIACTKCYAEGPIADEEEAAALWEIRADSTPCPPIDDDARAWADFIEPALAIAFTALPKMERDVLSKTLAAAMTGIADERIAAATVEQLKYYEKGSLTPRSSEWVEQNNLRLKPKGESK